MAGSKRPPKHDQPSIKYRWNSTEVAAFKLADFVPEEYASTASDYKKQRSKRSESMSGEILSMAELISAVDQIWDCANRLSVFQPKVNLNQNHSSCQEENILDDLCRVENSTTPLSGDNKSFNVDSRTAGQLSPTLQPKFKFLKVTEKMSLFEPRNENYCQSFLWRLLRGCTNLPNESWKGMGIGTVGISYELGNMYQWMKEMVPAGIKHRITSTKIENKQTAQCDIPGNTSGCAGDCISGNTTSHASNLAIRGAQCYSDLVKSEDPSLSNNSELLMNTGITTSLYSDYHLMAAQDIKADNSVSRSPSSSLYADYHIDALSSCNSKHEGWQYLTYGKELLENERKKPEMFVTEDKKRMEIPSSAVEKPQYALAKQEHAFAGALAGVFVSLCLHPVDTVKTVIQSCSVEHKSVCYIGRSIVSERGLTGLYRGIASNIASSAPISAVYTFTYESVKGALLPLFPKEYCSLAHCMAGGCASVATSFIFTPSERIKQRMQVGSHYHNCWHALVGIIRKGGLPSLYTGWGAVLCRNVPHSIIKFYVYENLKQMMLSSLHSGAQPNTLQTLVCGGLAGSTAAFFTTPFDVVKTRLQTQIPGSRSQYDSVFHALQEICKQEGLKGLYRGLIPRLVMYMSQGALFFASYEFFKRFFSLEVSQLNAQRILHKQNNEDDSISAQSLFPSPSTSASAAASSS